MTKPMKKSTKAENIMRAITVTKSHWAVPKVPATKACLIRDTFNESVIIVALSKKALVRVSLNATVSASALVGSNRTT